MTCVIAYVDDNNNVHMAADSNGTNVSYHTTVKLKTSKVFKRNGMLIGFTTSFRMGQLLEHVIKFPDREADITDLGYIVKQLIPAIRTSYLDEGYMLSTEKLGGTFVIAWNGNLYKIEDSFTVLHVDEKFLGCGSGADFAEAVMATLEYNDLLCSIDKIPQMLEQALAITSRRNITVSGRIDYINDIP